VDTPMLFDWRPAIFKPEKLFWRLHFNENGYKIRYYPKYCSETEWWLLTNNYLRFISWHTYTFFLQRLFLSVLAFRLENEMSTGKFNLKMLVLTKNSLLNRLGSFSNENVYVWTAPRVPKPIVIEYNRWCFYLCLKGMASIVLQYTE